MVPGGQQIWLTREGEVGVGRPHSGFVPPGAKVGGFRAFKDGGWVREDLDGWEACGRGPVWKLRGRNGTRSGNGTECVGVNLRVKKAEGIGAWEYT